MAIRGVNNRQTPILHITCFTIFVLLQNYTRYFIYILELNTINSSLHVLVPFKG